MLQLIITTKQPRTATKHKIKTHRYSATQPPKMTPIFRITRKIRQFQLNFYIPINLRLKETIKLYYQNCTTTLKKIIPII